MGLRHIKTNASVTPADVALWLPLIVEAIKGTQLKVKTEDDAVYVALGSDSQLAIYPESEQRGKFERQVKDKDVVRVSEEGTYDTLKKLLEIVTKASTNSSRSAVKTTNAVGNRRVLKAGRSSQEAIRRGKQKSRSVLTASRKKVMNLNSGCGCGCGNCSGSCTEDCGSSAMETELLDALSVAADSTQAVKGVLFNKPDALTGEPALYLAYTDTEEDLVVVTRVDVSTDGGVFNTPAEMVETCFGTGPVGEFTDEFLDEFIDTEEAPEFIPEVV